MTWGYLGEFWNSITQVGDYTITFFQNIGNAVAGAIGNLFSFINHSLSDLFVFGGWFAENLGSIWDKIVLPFQYLLQFLKSFVTKAVATPTTNEDIWSFTTQIKEVFSAIPFWSVLISVLFIAILIIVIISILKQILTF